MSAIQDGSIFSQPALTGAGRLENTQLASAVDALKREPNPVRLHDFALGLGSGFEALLDSTSPLYARFTTHERVVLNRVNDTITYRPDYELHSASDLLELVRSRWDAVYPPHGVDPPPGMRRLPLKPVIRLADLRESWPDAKNAVELLSSGGTAPTGGTGKQAKAQQTQGQQGQQQVRSERELLVWKQHKDGAPKTVAWNPLRPSALLDDPLLAGPQAVSSGDAGGAASAQAAQAVEAQRRANAAEPGSGSGSGSGSGGKGSAAVQDLMHVDQEFQDLWHGLKSPDQVDLQKELEAEGLRLTATIGGPSGGGAQQQHAGGAGASFYSQQQASSAPISAFGTKGMLHGDKSSSSTGGSRGRGTRGGRGGGTSRGGAMGGGAGRGRGSSSRKPKIMNTHLEGIDLTKDYV